MEFAIIDAKKRGWPLTTSDIIKERVNFEDRLLRMHEKVEHDPEVMKVELPSQKWSPVVNHVFGRGIIKVAQLLIP